MKVEIKLYKTFDPELYALSAYGIKVTNLIKIALEHYVRGEYVHFHIPRSLVYDFSMKKRSVHLAMEITDDLSIKFLRNEIKPRLRSAFLKSLVRGSFSTPQLGVFFKNEGLNKEDTRMIKMSDFDDLLNLKVLEVNQNIRRDYSIPMLNENGQVSQVKENKKRNNKKNKKRQIKHNVPTPNQSNHSLKQVSLEEEEIQEIQVKEKYGIEIHPNTPNAQLLVEQEEDDDEDANMFAAMNSLRN